MDDTGAEILYQKAEHEQREAYRIRLQENLSANRAGRDFCARGK